MEQARIMSDMQLSPINFYEQVLSLRAQRQQLLASNIANADTPNYKAVDIDFNSAMQAALQQVNPAELKLTSSSHLPNTGTIGNADIKERASKQNSLDGNTVDMDIERAQFTENALQYEAAITLINNHFKNIASVIQNN
uniref:flagellar basal body rod protein FlgB n=2 Tax=Polynucleobacter sp. TaxID=2029855 RepID=UPI004048D1B2